ncbi:hypothetical protein [Nocardioides caldifontis]|uniref:hypothetical protein n=1 Tax=Nocardioides caldifontis TaxID=2588938 RepID=UPI0013967827|nr:hypothetical protein [Nocardioides caldifontis]
MTLLVAVPLEQAAGTSLVVITLTSAAALVVRSGVGAAPERPPVLALTAARALPALA